jgi:hypothetical protein
MKTKPTLAPPAICHSASIATMIERNILLSKWQFPAASLVGLTGAFFGGISGSLAAGFAGDAWWTNTFALNVYQYALTFGGVCLGAVPGAVWLLCLRQRCVLPFLWAAGCALLHPALSSMYMNTGSSMHISRDTIGLLYGGFVISGFVVGIAIWIFGRRRLKS